MPTDQSDKKSSRPCKEILKDIKEFVTDKDNLKDIQNIADNVARGLDAASQWPTDKGPSGGASSSSSGAGSSKGSGK
ncbi:MAG: hypothetical protein M1820_000559 [Bogoriella megaspora]|nr:MAG: hypothetical protein M1820_000559 [Bogoriella megaspora]